VAFRVAILRPGVTAPPEVPRYQPPLLLLVAAVVALSSPPVAAQNAPALPSVGVSATVMRSGDIFIYTYVVTNSSKSTAPLWTIAIDARQQRDELVLQADDLSPGQGFLVDTAKALEATGKARPSVAAVAGAPPGWMASRSLDGLMTWGAESHAFLLPPGARLSGFAITSRGLPGIRALRAEPYFEPNDYLDAPTDDLGDHERYDKERSALEARVRFLGHTVGPLAPPLVFEAGAFIRRIEGYLDSAAELGWVANRGIRMSLQAKLNAAAAALTRGQARVAVNTLTALLHEVDAQTGKHLTAEAAALLRFNTEYLIAQLR
jgi:hypothetical protein